MTEHHNGSPHDDLSHDHLTHDESRARRPSSKQVLRRSQDRVVAGIAGGVASFINANPTAVRWGFGLLLVFSGGIFLIAYLLLWLLLPGPEGA